jgi:hypothetical protein
MSNNAFSALVGLFTTFVLVTLGVSSAEKTNEKLMDLPVVKHLVKILGTFLV